MQALLGIGAGAALVAGSVLLNAAFPLERKLDNWLAVATLAWSQIVLASVVLSELRAIGLPGLLACHLVVFVLALMLWLRRGRSSPASLYFPPPRLVAAFFRRNALLTVFVSALALILVARVLTTTFVQSDAYHIARAHYWVQNRTARHFYTDDLRQIERPPNSSFLYMWQILVTGSYGGLNIPQWLAAMGVAVAIAALATSAGHSQPAAMFASAIFLSLPCVVLQMSTPWNDLLAAFSAFAFTHFAIKGVVHSRLGPPDVRARIVGYAGIAFGLMAGTKHTPLALLPALGGVFMVLLARRFRDSLPVLVRLSLWCMTGFLTLGAYNYVLNILEFGSPITSTALVPTAQGTAGADSGPQAGGTDTTVANGLRYVYQTMDWVLLKPIPGAGTLYALNNSAYRGVDKLLDLDLEAAGQFNLGEFGLRRLHNGKVGFGPLGYGMAVGSPIVLAIMIGLLRRGSKYSTSAILLVLALGSLAVISTVRPWAPSQARYLTPAFALLTAALVPHAYARRPLALLWLLPMGFLALWSAYGAAEAAQGSTEKERFLAAWQVRVLESSLPPDATIAVVGKVKFLHYFEEFRGYRFQPVPEVDVIPALLSGDFDAALVYDPQDSWHEYRLPLEPDQSFLVSDPRKVLLANLDNYGAHIESTDSSPVLHLRDSGLIQRADPDLVRFFFPTTGPLELEGPLALEMSFPVQAPSEEALSLICGGFPVRISVEGRLLFGEIPAAAIDRSQPTHLCRLHIQDLHFGRRIPPGSIEVHLRTVTPP